MTLYPRPDEVTNKCNHSKNPPNCRCVHDWRIFWGNKTREIAGELGGNYSG